MQPALVFDALTTFLVKQMFLEQTIKQFIFVFASRFSSQEVISKTKLDITNL